MLPLFNILKRNKDLLNRINVFPIADGDTGRNLLQTVESFSNVEFINLKDFLKRASEGSFMSARGSSGNILALYIMGLYQNYSEDLSAMCKEAAKFTWDTMYNPVEGTILTAMKDVPKKYDSTEDFVYKFIQNTYDNLMEGPDILPVLKENNTLDSGTLGFLYILCDIYWNLTGKDISPNIEIGNPIMIKKEGESSRYCVEVMLNISNPEFKQKLANMGEELIYLSLNDGVKFHIHVKDYREVMNVCKDNIIEYKIEDMKNNNERIYL